MLKDTKARSFKISKLKSLLENLETLLRLVESVIHQNLNHSFKLGSKLKYLNLDQLPLSKCSELGYSKSAPTNVE